MVRLGLDTLIDWLQYCMYVCMYVYMYVCYLVAAYLVENGQGLIPLEAIAI